MCNKELLKIKTEKKNMLIIQLRIPTSSICIVELHSKYLFQFRDRIVYDGDIYEL